MSTIDLKCKTCANAIFHKAWGDYKCGVTQNYVYGVKVECPDYKEGTPKDSKERLEDNE